MENLVTNDLFASSLSVEKPYVMTTKKSRYFKTNIDKNSGRRNILRLQPALVNRHPFFKFPRL